MGGGALAVLAAVGIATPARASSSAVSWGGGYLGNGTAGESTSPVAVSGLSSGVATVGVGSGNSLAVQNGALYKWGSNNDQTSYFSGNATYSVTPVAVSGFTSGVTAADGGFFHSLALQNGGVYAFGQNADGQLGNGTTNNSAAPVAVTSLSSGVTAIAGGGYHSLAIRNGGVYAWGRGDYGQMGNGTTTGSTTPVAVTGLSTGVTAIAGGGYFSMAVKSGGVVAWGDNSYGQLGNVTGGTSTTPVAVTSLSTGVTAIAAGSFHSLAVKNGVVYAWGDNGNGELGNGTTQSVTTPLAVPGITGSITAVAAGDESSYALAADGSIWDWGDNQAGELGLGTTTTQYNTPQHLLAPAGYAYTSVAAKTGGYHAVATLSRPDAAIAASATGTVLGSVSPTGSDAAGYNVQTLVLSGLTIAGSVQINGNLSNTSRPNAVYLTLNTPSQAGALIADLNNVYGAGTASAATGQFQVMLTLPTSAGSPDYFNFDFTTVVGAGPADAVNPAENDVGSVAIDDIGFTAAPEPASLGLTAMAVAGLLGRRRRHVRG
jgi:alpha-tubulin suppressor-like RCC1 family protein